MYYSLSSFLFLCPHIFFYLFFFSSFFPPIFLSHVSPSHIHQSHSQAAGLWALRESAPTALSGAGLMCYKYDLSLPVAAFSEVILSTTSSWALLFWQLLFVKYTWKPFFFPFSKVFTFTSLHHLSERICLFVPLFHPLLLLYCNCARN
jgi:hypothetical protein